MKPDDLIVTRPEGLFCPPGGFYVDPWQPVDRAIITHAHADHARFGSTRYLAAAPAERVLRTRLGDIALQSIDYGATLDINGVAVSLFPAGHVLGSAQVRLAVGGRVWVVSGDYKLDFDPTCAPFEPVRCDVFVTESTFGLPVFRWQDPAAVFAQLNAWWARNAAARRTSIVYCYAFGKAQRILAGIDASIGPVLCHGAVARLNHAYEASGVALAPWRRVADVADPEVLRRALVLAPPSAQGSAWVRRFGTDRDDYSDAFASGWMQLRGARRRRALDRGFVLSDHADWPGLNRAIAASGAGRVIVTHGYAPIVVRWLEEQGTAAEVFATEFGDEESADVSVQDDAGDDQDGA
jgi:putative mRNA 3-end processing factor